MDKRKLLMTTQSLFALSALLLGMLVQWHLIRVWHIVAVSFFGSVLLAADQPARQVSWAADHFGVGAATACGALVACGYALTLGIAQRRLISSLTSAAEEPAKQHE